MTTTNLTEADRRVRESVTRQLDWDPEVEDSAVGVQRDAAGQAVAHAPGITEVDNRIVVEPPGRPEVLEEIC